MKARMLQITIMVIRLAGYPLASLPPSLPDHCTGEGFKRMTANDFCRLKVLIMGANRADSLELCKILAEGGFRSIKTAEDCKQTQKVILEFKPDLILLDLCVPYQNRCEVMHHVRQNEDGTSIPVITLTMSSNYQEIAQTYEEGALDYIQKPFLPVDVLKRVDRVLNDYIRARYLQDNHHMLEKLMVRRKQELEEEVEDEFSRLYKIVAGRNVETGLHIHRIGQYVNRLSLLKGLSQEYAKSLKYASMLHDIGKIAIPDSVLLKPGRLTDNEVALMHRHTIIGAQMLSGSNKEVIRLAESIALTHHERWDGNGYPHQLREREIPIGGRITAICDVYDALLSRRPYKKAWDQNDVRAEIMKLRGKAFDPELVDLFLDNEKLFIHISKQ